MKALKIILGVIAGLVVLFVLWNALSPSSYRVERSTTIDADMAAIKTQITNLRNWDNWSPWKGKDPNAEYSYSGVDDGVGAGMSWKGNDSLGVGTLTISEVTDGQVSYSLSFKEPWESTSNGGFVFAETDSGVLVTWFDMGDLPFMARWMAAGMDAMIGKDFEKGLLNLKKHCESLPEAPIIQVEVSAVSAINFYSITDSCAAEQLGTVLGDLYGRLMQAIDNAGISPTGAPFAIYETWDGISTRLKAGIPVADNSLNLGDSIEALVGYEGPVLKVVYYGPYEGSSAAHEAIDVYAKENGMEVIGAPWEVYVTDPSQEPDSSKWVTEIYYPIK
jgi:effector-binding domain-containing protein